MFMIDLRAIGGGFDGCEQAIQARKAYVVKTFSNVQEACPGSMHTTRRDWHALGRGHWKHNWRCEQPASLLHILQ